MRKEKAPIYKLYRSKAPKTQQVCHCRHERKTSAPFFVLKHCKTACYCQRYIQLYLIIQLHVIVHLHTNTCRHIITYSLYVIINLFLITVQGFNKYSECHNKIGTRIMTYQRSTRMNRESSSNYQPSS